MLNVQVVTEAQGAFVPRSRYLHKNWALTLRIEYGRGKVLNINGIQ